MTKPKGVCLGRAHLRFGKAAVVVNIGIDKLGKVNIRQLEQDCVVDTYGRYSTTGTKVQFFATVHDDTAENNGISSPCSRLTTARQALRRTGRAIVGIHDNTSFGNKPAKERRSARMPCAALFGFTRQCSVSCVASPSSSPGVNIHRQKHVFRTEGSGRAQHNIRHA